MDHRFGRRGDAVEEGVPQDDGLGQQAFLDLTDMQNKYVAFCFPESSMALTSCPANLSTCINRVNVM